MKIEPPLKPKLIDFGINESDFEKYSDLKPRIEILEKYIFRGIAVVISLVLTIVFAINFSDKFYKLPVFFQSQFGEITLYLIVFIGAFGLQIFIFPILLINTFITSFLLKVILGDKQIVFTEDYKMKIIDFNHKLSEYSYKLNEFWSRYPDSKRFGEDFPEYIEFKQKQQIEIERFRQEINYWLELSGYQFEKEIAQIYEKMGFHVQLTKSSGDGGIDIILFDKVNNKIIVQCKNHKQPVGPSIIRELYGVMISEKAVKAILICSSGFTEGVYSFSKGKPIELLTLKEVIELNKKYCAQ